MSLLRAVMALAVFAGALAASAPAASAAPFGCDASAVRVTLATAPPVEPVTANHGQSACRNDSNSIASLPGLPIPLAASLVSAATTVTGAGGPDSAQTAQATASIADIGIGPVLPPLPITFPPGTPTSVTIPSPLPPPLNSSLTIDLTPALDALAKTANLLGLSVASAQVNGRCSGGGAVLSGTSNVAGLSVLGQDLPVNQAISQTMDVFGGGSIDPSQIDPTLIPLPPALSGLAPAQVAAVQQAIKTAAASLPPIPIPAQLAQVTITPNSETNSGGVLTRQALHVNIKIGGQQLLDFVAGEARVSAAGQPCLTPGAAASQAALQCTKRRLTLIDVLPVGRRVHLLGAADLKYVGKRVSIVFTGNHKVVARPKVARDGSFRATAPLPARSIRGTNRARYYATIAHTRSLRLKLMRRMLVAKVSSRSGKVTIAGRVVRPLARPVRLIEVRRRLSCHHWQVVKHIHPGPSGAFKVTLKAPRKGLAAVYRLATRVRKVTTNPKTYPTFTLPRAVAIFR